MHGGAQLHMVCDPTSGCRLDCTRRMLKKAWSRVSTRHIAFPPLPLNASPAPSHPTTLCLSKRLPPTLFRLVTRNTTETQIAITNTLSGQCGVTMDRMQQACRARDPGRLRKRLSAAAFYSSTLPTHHTTTEDQNPARCLTKSKTCTR